ncbi:sugar transferase [Rhizobium ruizarguesonis]|uniref:sugar transferase n=1 Tax=Rhizobium ruizarguesonis TaxID=2081791 RepID=UPI00103054A8|nr:sugar transferase [Rhizobium ruizarguesonis]TBA86287.1 sugar transferase [Rhizobium ruizarguesonis]
MGSLIAVIIIVCGVLGSAFSKILADEFKAWRPNIVRRMIGIAASLLSDADRDRYHEEWSAYVEDVPGDLGKLFSASGFVWAAARMSDRRLMALGTKRAMDVSIAATSLLLLFPPMLATALAIKIESPGPVLFAHRRLGKGGKEIFVYKFRSTRLSSEDQSGQVTRIGKLIRRSNIDELPQLINILRGDMSLVGPRPFPAHIANDEAESEIMKARQKVRPGLTGLAQLLPPGRDHFRDSLVSDLFYVAHHSTALDLVIILKTVVAEFFSVRRPELTSTLLAMVALLLPVAIMVGIVALLA